MLIMEPFLVESLAQCISQRLTETLVRTAWGLFLCAIRNAMPRSALNDRETWRHTMMKAVALAFAVLASGTIVASAQGVTVEVPGVKVTPPRVDIERRLFL